MPKINWSADQKKVIETRDCNLLVAAAAGSGKTAVLVERILTLISDSSHPIDIDHLLVVTFTKAAAAQMREKIGEALEEKLENEPGNLHLQKQFTLLQNAKITTIDSFCLHVIQNYFHHIDLDPAFRIADDTELLLLQQDILSELLEDRYEQGSEDFCRLIDAYGGKRSDNAIETQILRLYKYAISYPFPIEWLENCVTMYSDMDSDSPWLSLLLAYLKNCSEDMVTMVSDAIALCQSPAGPTPYLPVLEQEKNMILPLQQANTLEEFQKYFSCIYFDRLPACRDKNVDSDIQNQVKYYRDSIKKKVTSIKSDFLYAPYDSLQNTLQNTKPYVAELISLTKEFYERFAAAKREKGVLDFSDLEHFALSILIQKDEGSIKPSACALELQNQYEEILIDEYQDSNFVQEYILNSISRENTGRPNIFMVGDVKQSIYRFRQARPELFMEKYETYSLEPSPYQKIDLHQNFRSRTKVLDGINEIFYSIMCKKLGGICYDEAAALYPGATYPDEENPAYLSELLILPPPAQKEEESAVFDAREIEIRAIGKRILELTAPDSALLVRGENKVRPARFSDIVILLRSMSGWSEQLVSGLQEMGIPAYAETRSGYFSALEVQTMLNLLRIIDNPRQDIPLTAILRSEIVEMADDELAVLGKLCQGIDLWEGITTLMENGLPPQDAPDTPESIREITSRMYAHLTAFYTKLTDYRKKSLYMSVPALLQFIYEDSFYYYYIAAMPDGEKRASNLDMLLQKAEGFGQGNRHGLFQFVRYIDQLHKYEIDYGEAATATGEIQAVHIMTIHKSKGLEFPIVFLCAAGKQFNLQDSRSKFVLHPDLGIGMNYVDLSTRLAVPTILKKVIAKAGTLDTLGEELRLLYVAMTRAKEKLIVTGYDKSFDADASLPSDYKKPLSFHSLSTAKSYLDWLKPVILSGAKHWCWQSIEIPDLLNAEIKSQLLLEQRMLSLHNFDSSREYHSGIRRALKEQEAQVYLYQNELKLPAKLSVSHLKESAYTPEETESVSLFASDSKEVPLPRFLMEEAKAEGAVRGNVYHKFMEHFPYEDSISDEKALQAAIDKQVQSGILTASEAGMLSTKTLLAFIHEKLYQRMQEASHNNTLHREQPFILAVPANSLYPDAGEGENILVQGIIDAYFEEEDGLVLVDYKTDRFPKKEGEAFLIRQYEKQLQYYAKALTSITGIPVKEKIIFSFHLGKCIWV